MTRVRRSGFLQVPEAIVPHAASRFFPGLGWRPRSGQFAYFDGLSEVLPEAVSVEVLYCPRWGDGWDSPTRTCKHPGRTPHGLMPPLPQKA